MRNMASGKKAESGKHEQGVNGRRSSKRKEGPIVMDTKAVFAAVYEVCEENAAFFSSSPKGGDGGGSSSSAGSSSGSGGGGVGGGGGGGGSSTVRRLVEALSTIQEHARSLEPVVAGFAAIYHHFDFDPHIPANGYRSLVKVVRCCLLHIVHKGRYIAASRRSIFFRVAHQAGEMEAYSRALCQLRALLYLAQRLLHDNGHGNLFFQEESGLSQSFMREYASMHKGCFYGRCLGFQFTPSIRPYLQTMAIGLVAFSENYRKHQSGIEEASSIAPYGVAASSFFTSGKYAIDPELRGSEYERITQNLDVHFWKSFWNITETEILASLASMTSVQVKVNRMLQVPGVAFDLPLAANPKESVTIPPPTAHIGSAPVQMRLISHELREGQDSEELLAMSRSEGGPMSLSLGLKSKRSAPSPWLLVHYHGGGFVAQTSKSHEPYLKSWSQELGVPILSVDYSLAPEAPFPRALEECFYAYCWALKNSHLLGWTGERVCLAGDSAGGNLCVTTSLRAASVGVRLPDGLVTAYPATLLTAYASPSRLLTLMDPLLPLSVLSRCLSAYGGVDVEPHPEKQVERVSALSTVRRDTALLLSGFRQGASNWIHSLLDHHRPNANAATVAFWRLWLLLRRPLTLLVPSLHSPSTASSYDTVRKSVSEATLSSPHADPPVPPKQPSDFSKNRDSLKSRTCQDLGSHLTAPHTSTLLTECTPQDEDVSFFLCTPPDDPSMSTAMSEVAIPPPDGDEGNENPREFPLDFEPLRSEQTAQMPTQSSPLVRNPYMSPLLAPDAMLKTLPPIHIVACALDPMLDDSVMFAKRVRGVERPVTLCVVDDLPHGFLSLSQLTRETREATSICVQRIREVFQGKDANAPLLPANGHRKLERANANAPDPLLLNPDLHQDNDNTDDGGGNLDCSGVFDGEMTDDYDDDEGVMEGEDGGERQGQGPAGLMAGANNAVGDTSEIGA